MQNTRLNTPSSSSGGGINRGDRKSSSPPNPESPNLSPLNIITPSSPSRFIGPLPNVHPAYISRVESILRSFPTDTDPAEIYAALKARLGVSRSRNLTSPPPADGTPTQYTQSRQQVDGATQTTRAAIEASKTVESRGQGQEEEGRKCPSSSQEGPPFQPRFGGYQRSPYASQRKGEKE